MTGETLPSVDNIISDVPHESHARFAYTAKEQVRIKILWLIFFIAKQEQIQISQ